MTSPAFPVDASKFNSFINTRAAVFRRSRDVEVKAQALLLARELIKRTPPLDGKTIAKVVKSRGQELRNPETEQLKAKQIGERAIARDRSRKLKGKGLKKEEIQQDIEKRQANVGRAKAGWMPSFVKAGGKRPSPNGWIGRHSDTHGAAVELVSNGVILFELINRSSWASVSETARVIRESIARRERAMANQIRNALEKTFGKGAGASFR